MARRGSKDSGSVNSRSSRLAQIRRSTTRWPAPIGTPATSVSTVTVRPTNCSGSWWRSISSNAVGTARQVRDQPGALVRRRQSS